ncbi:hypothetical protein [Embleya sp. NBC_00896]|uniref:hypothetical protein n=1 Tax=Embleya sp. NBC_00896 TaxID=2975961 RepID=UPI002F91BCFC|nr:hypothetical protein OG928_37455 [Embleya sp. NBC_00896]
MGYNAVCSGGPRDGERFEVGGPWAHVDFPEVLGATGDDAVFWRYAPTADYLEAAGERLQVYDFVQQGTLRELASIGRGRLGSPVLPTGGSSPDE